MRYFSYSEPLFDIDSSNTTHATITYSEEDIRQLYYPEWYDEMCSTYGKETVDKYYTFEHCLHDWVARMWAWELKSPSTENNKK